MCKRSVRIHASALTRKVEDVLFAQKLSNIKLNNGLLFAQKLANINVSNSAAPKLPFVPACRYFRKKILKILLLRNRKEMKLKIDILALDIVLYKSYYDLIILVMK